MPELPDIELYRAALAERVLDQPVEAVDVKGPFLLRTVDPPLASAVGRRVVGIRRVGKRIVLQLEDDLFLVVHLMIAGRLKWREAGAKIPAKVGLAAFRFPTGTLILTEAGSKKRASLHVVQGEAALTALDPGGLDVAGSSTADIAAAIRRERRTLKRALTDPRILSGVGNAYSDEILHRARMSPFTLTDTLDDDAMARLHAAAKTVLAEWTERLAEQAAGEFPEKVTAFHPEMAVHGRYGQPCPVCGTAVQRVRYADNEMNYCPGCQTGGRLMADRSLSRLLKKDWPRTLDELEALKRR